jgi:hypothetical protein
VGQPVSPPLHVLLRDLVSRQGPGVVETAEGFRAALDDFLTEDEATTGELNLLVDAVRLGAVSRLLSILDHGADPAAAIQEAGDAMARDRGTDDATRSRWAVAALGFALGRLSEDDVRPQAGTQPKPPPAVPPPPPPPTQPPTERAAGQGPATLGDQTTEQSTWDDAAPPPLPPAPPPTRRRTWPVVIALIVLVLIAGGVVGWLLYDDEPDGSARDGDPPTETAEPSVDPSVDPSAEVPPELPSNTILISANDGEDTRVYRVNADTGEVLPLTSGPSDNFPTVSRDRERVVFLVRATEHAVRPVVLDLASQEITPLFADDGACEYGRRPGFDFAGERLALVCLTAEDEQTGLFVVNPDGTLDTQVEVDGGVRGSPTWVSDSEIVYARGEESGDTPSALVQVNVDTGEERVLTDGTEGWDSQPVWCEARSTLLFVRSDSRAQQGELWTLTDRGFEEPLPMDEPVAGPVWSPGCGQLAFTVEGEDGPVLVTAPSDNPADYTPVDEIRGEITAPAWDTR